MLKDRFGFMWFGTQSGVNKFDGYKFTVYTHSINDPKSIVSNDIAAMCEDKEGNIWIATKLGGISQYDPGSASFINYQEKANDLTSLSSNETNIIYEDRRGNIWVGTIAGLNLFNKKTKKFVQYIANPKDNSSLSSSRIFSLHEDSKGNFWVGTDNGLNLMNRQTGKCTQYLYDPFEKNSIASNYVNKIFEDSYGNLWLGTNAGLDLLDKNSKSFTHFGNGYVNNKAKQSSGLVNAIVQDANFLWIGTKTLLLFDIQKRVFVDYSDQYRTENEIKDFEIYSLLLDDNILWAGTNSGGIYQYDKNLARFADFKLGPKNSRYNIIWSFAEDQKGNIWVGTDAGLSYFNRVDSSFTNYTRHSKNKNSISGIPLSVLTTSENNDVWIGTEKGLDLYSPRTGIFKHFADEKGALHLPGKKIRKLFEDSKGNIWIGTSNEGVMILDKKKQQFTKFKNDPKNPNSLSSNEGIYAFCEDKEGNIWISTYAGIDVFTPGNNQFTHHNCNNNLLDNISAILSLYADSKGDIWIGTVDDGLIWFDKKTNDCVAYGKQQGLVNNTINSIVGDKKGFLWLSTNEGIVRFDPVNKKFRNYSVSHGLQDEEFDVGAGILTKSGEIFFGGINGFNVFNPDSLPQNKNIPPVVLTGFELFNKTIVPGAKGSVLQQSILETKEITLSYDQSVFSFEFAALNYTFPEKNQYTYKLEGFDDEWNYTANKRTATYTNLDPGTYVFRVKGSNNDGVWNETGTSVEITITPPFWLTWWFRLGVVLLIAGSSFSFFWHRMDRTQKQKILLEEKVKGQTIQLIHSNEELANKNIELEQFVYIASHDLREPLRTTSSFVELFQKQYKGKLDAKADQYLSYISQSADRMKMLIDDLLDYSKIGSSKELQQLDCNIILQEVLTDLGTALTEAGAQISYDNLPVVNGHPTALKQLFQNLVTNGIKFRKKDISPKIHIRAEIKGDAWQFSFKDNGIGIDPQHREKIFIIFQRLHTKKEYEGSGIGLAHCKKIVELHKGNIWVDSTPAEGSIFHFTIPFIKN